MDNRKQSSATGRKKMRWNLAINLLLLLSGFVMIVSGLTLQQAYHRNGVKEQRLAESEVDQADGGSDGNPLQYEQLRGIDTNKRIVGLGYAGWATVHKWAIVFLSLLMLYHIQTHWKWYKRAIPNALIRKNIYTATMSVLFFVVALTGIIPWLVDLAGGKSVLRLFLIELHDKIALLLIILLIIHLGRRMKWYISTFNKLKYPENCSPVVYR